MKLDFGGSRIRFTLALDSDLGSFTSCLTNFVILESALNYIGDEDLSREPSPTKSPFPDITESQDPAENRDNTDNGDNRDRPGSTEPGSETRLGAVEEGAVLKG